MSTDMYRQLVLRCLVTIIYGIIAIGRRSPEASSIESYNKWMETVDELMDDIKNLKES